MSGTPLKLFLASFLAASFAAASPAAAEDLARLLALDGGAAERREMARALMGSLPADRVLEATPALADPDAGVRTAVVELMARGDLGALGRPERAEALIRVARRDPATEVRLAAIEALGALGVSPKAAEALGGLTRTAPRRAERIAAAEALTASPAGESIADGLVRNTLGGRGLASPDGLIDGALAALLPGYARRLADRTPPPESDLVPLVIALRHPAAPVRRAAGEAFQAAISRLAELRGAGRASAFLARMSDLGLERDVALYESARLALTAEGDGRIALERALELRRLVATTPRPRARVDGFEAALWRFRAELLAGAAHLALGAPERAEGFLGAAAEAVDRALAERRDLRAPSERSRHVDLLQQRALAQLMVVACAIAAGEDDLEVLERARVAHRLTLEAQALTSEIRGDALAGFDLLFASDLSPQRLLFSAEATVLADGLDRREALDIAGRFGRALASVAPGELPGFAALRPSGLPDDVAARLFDPLADPEREALLQRTRAGRLGGLDDVIDEAEELIGRLQLRSMGLIPEDAYTTRDALRRQRRFLASEPEREEPGSRTWVRDLRLPSSAALWHAQDLAEEGRAAEARAIAERLEADIDARGISPWWYLSGHDIVIRARLLAGSTLTDEGRGKDAEAVLLSAAERIEDLERELEDRGASGGELDALRALHSTALVSLAVNANVRLGDREKANGYYERAYDMRKDEFMRTLLACYRARAGRGEEARALVRTIKPGPGTWYNLACTYALLGDAERALEMLEAELTLNHGTEQSAAKQRQWAAEDPDLASLRGLARFQALVRGR